jgi:hypothetical protein
MRQLSIIAGTLFVLTIASTSFAKHHEEGKGKGKAMTAGKCTKCDKCKKHKDGACDCKSDKQCSKEEHNTKDHNHAEHEGHAH